MNEESIRSVSATGVRGHRVVILAQIGLTKIATAQTQLGHGSTLRWQSRPPRRPPRHVGNSQK